MSRKPPVKHTCPDIDSAIDDIKSAKMEISNWEDVNYNDKRFVFNKLEDAISAFEDLRKANSALREWGEELVKELEELEQNIE